METDKRLRPWVSCAVISASIAGLFWWGFQFKIFDSDIDFIKRPEQLGFFGFIVMAAFGAGFGKGGAATGLRAAVWTAFLLMVAGLIGTWRSAAA
jgi:hypothetical protein